jgi:hypothetical protein
VTNTTFTRDALWAATQEVSRHFLRLRDFEALKRWLQNNFWSPDDWREIPTYLTLAPGVTIEIPKPDLLTPLEFWPMPIVNKIDYH